MIRVCLVDDQTLVRQGIRSLLELSDNIRIVAEAGDGKQALDKIAEVRPDVVLLDMRMPVMGGIETLQHLSQRGDLPPTIILTTFDDDQMVLQGIKLGARGFLLCQALLLGLRLGLPIGIDVQAWGGGVGGRVRVGHCGSVRWGPGV